MQNQLEKDYIKSFSQGDIKAFEWLFLRYQPKLVLFLCGFLKDEELARDLSQDIFFTIWKNREKYSFITSFKSYLFKMGKNAVCNYYDHSLVIEKYEKEFILSSSLTESNIEENLFVKDLQEQIAFAIDQMPPQRKKIYQMSREEGLSNSEIAEQTGINKRTVENHLTSAISDLKKVTKKFILFIIYFS